MKRRDLVRLLERNGWKLVRNGSGHDVYMKGTEMETVERHREIPEPLARAIIRRRALK